MFVNKLSKKINKILIPATRRQAAAVKGLYAILIFATVAGVVALLQKDAGTLIYIIVFVLVTLIFVSCRHEYRKYNERQTARAQANDRPSEQENAMNVDATTNLNLA